MCPSFRDTESPLLRLALVLGWLAVPFLVSSLGSSPVQAQATTGGFTCTVLDREDGKPIRSARVKLESSALFQPRIYVTDSKGEIRAVLLPVGLYRMSVQQPGYRAVVVDDLRISVGANPARTLDMIRLQGVEGPS